MHDILQEENIKLKHTESGNQKTKCPKCQPPHNSRDNPLSVTIDGDSAVWKCHHCDWSGTTLRGNTTNFVSRPKKVYVAPKTPADPKTPPSLYKYFADRGISQKVVEAMQIYVDQDVWIAMPYFDENGATVNILSLIHI